MPEHPYDLVVSAVLFKTDEHEVERMIAMVAGIPVRTQLILIDNDPDKKMGEHTKGAVTRITTGSNLGYGRAQNIAIERSASLARYHLAANTDIVFDGADIRRMVKYMDENIDIGMCAPHVRFPDGRRQFLCRLLPTPVDLFARRFLSWTSWGQARQARNELRNWSYDVEADIPFLSGCFMLLRRATIDRVGGFDPRFFLYCEDLDLSRRFHQQSRTRFLPWVTITHDYRSKQRGGWKLIFYHFANTSRYFSKWGWFVDTERDRINAKSRALLALPSKTSSHSPSS